MNNKKKQTAVVAMAAIMSVTSIASPMAVMAQENAPAPPAIMQDENQQQKTAPEIVLPENLQATAGTALEEIPLPEGWAWVENSTVITEETAEYPARFRVDDVTYDYSNIEGYNAEGHYVERMVVITVEPAKSEPAEQAEPVQEKANKLLEDTPTTLNTEDIVINDTNFPDKAFRDYVTDNFDTDKSGKLSTTEIAGITVINVSGNANIKDLTGIEHFSALTNLYCSNTGITSLNVSNNTALKTLACSDTPLAYLNIGDNNDLTVNKRSLKNPTIYVTTDTFMLKEIFSGIDITKISNLTGADWNSTTGEVSNYKFGTPITYDYACGTSKGGEETLRVELTVTDKLAIDETNFPDEVFRNYVRDNFDTFKDEELSTTEIAGITAINVSNNREIKDLKGIEHFTALEYLSCYSTGITSLNVSKNTALKELWCNNTGIESLDVSHNTALTTLFCPGASHLQSYYRGTRR